MEPPSQDWCRIELQSLETVVFVTTSLQMNKRLEMWHEKAVCFTALGRKLTAKVYIQGVLHAEKAVTFCV